MIAKIAGWTAVFILSTISMRMFLEVALIPEIPVGIKLLELAIALSIGQVVMSLYERLTDN